MTCNRKEFFGVATAFAAATPMMVKAETQSAAAKVDGQAFTAGEPVLESPSETSVGVAWAVNRLSTGIVQIADNPQMQNMRSIKAGGLPLACLDGQSLSARITGLRPSTRYWYRTVTQEIVSGRNPGYAAIRRGESLEGRVHSFVTPGLKAESRFCVMNDTHAAWKSFAHVTAGRICVIHRRAF